MNRKQVTKFLDSIMPGIVFTYKLVDSKACGDSPAAVDSDCEIWINTDLFFTQYSDIEQRGILLHEVGHILIGDFKSKSDMEYYAQLMAICIAKANGWRKLFKELDKTITEWVDYKWKENHSEYRRYITAGKKYANGKRNGILAKL